MEAEGEEVKFQIKFGGETMKLSVSAETTIAHLKTTLQSSTNVLPRGQKLIHKGQVLEESKTLRSSGIRNGSKIMLMATQGLHQGEGPKVNDAPLVSKYKKILASTSMNEEKPREAAVVVSKNMVDRWKVLKSVPLSDSHLKAIPDQVWDVGSCATTLDLSDNTIHHIPAKLACMTSLRTLFLNKNDLSDDSICWDALTQLNRLTFLALSSNHLTYLPSSLGALTSLEQLHVRFNKLGSLPVEIGRLTRLEILKVDCNRILEIPSSIGGCSSLTTVDVSSNLLVELPETIGCLVKLQALYLRNNGLKSLPSSILKKCVKLSTLDLHGTEITVDMLRQVEGWEAFDERRRQKHQKQLDFLAGFPAEFDEGADRNW